MTTIELPFPPSVNRIWRQNRQRGGVYLDARYKTWKRAADNEFLAHKREWEPVKGPFRATITLDQAHRGRSDLDNRIKVLFDWAQRVGLIEQDNLCEGLHVRWGKAASGCRIVLTAVSRREAA